MATSKNAVCLAGFSLLELSISLVIIAMMASGIMVMSANIINNRRNIDTENKLEEIAAALQNFYELNGRLPCVARHDLTLGNASYGREILYVASPAADCSTDTTVPSGTVRVDNGSGLYVRIGALPVRDLLLRDEMIGDDFYSRITYAVTEDLTNAGDFAAASGAITVNDGTGTNIITNGAYVIVSHGKDGKGAYSVGGGVLKQTCNNGTGNLDIENCDGDAIFTDTRFNDGSIAAKFFDDIIRWKSKLSY